MRFRFGFIGIAWLYLALASLYAVNTPPWQVPDEPAHYNYIRTIAEQAALPVLQTGDYDQDYLEKIKREKFPPNLSIDAIRYESHQPPAYYLIATPFYKIGESAPTDVRLVGLRLVSVLWGVVLLAIVYRIATWLFPSDPLMPLLTVALVAFVPQHLAMEGGVNNDALAEVLLAGVVLALLKIIDEGNQGKLEEIRGNRVWWMVGLLMGLGFVTKTTTYVSVGLFAVTLLILGRQSPIRILSVSKDANRRSPIAIRHMRYAICDMRLAILSLAIALLIGSVWFARDALMYGPTDWLGLQRHNAVVVGQPRTLELYPNYLVAATDYFPTMFRSFWGQFGWMGVPLDARIYNALFFFSAFTLLGLVFIVRSPKSNVPIPNSQLPTSKSNHPISNIQYPTSDHATTRLRDHLTILAAWFLFTLAGTVAYSIEFYQAQGRYLFPALGAIAIFMAMGLRAWMRFIGRLVARVGIPCAVTEWALFGALAVCLIALDLICLYRFLIPELSR